MDETSLRIKTSRPHLLGNKHAAGKIPWNKGKKGVQIVGDETRRKLSKVHLGNTNAKYRKWIKEQRQKVGELIKKYHKEGRIKILKGVGSPNWRGGVTSINSLIRKSTEYKLWRGAVFKRDDYTCVWCRSRGKIIHADHIKPFALFPELRFSLDNGRTLCKPCHLTTNTYGGTRKPD